MRRRDFRRLKATQMQPVRVQSGIMRPRVVLGILSVGKRLRACLSQARFLCAHVKPASRHEWQTQPGSKRGLAFTSEAKSAQNRARIAVESRKSSGGATSGASEAIAGGSRPENLGIATPPWRTCGRTGKNPVNDLPLSNRSCPSDRCVGFER